MIAMLKGVLEYKSPQYLIIDVSGVGYQVFTSLFSFSRLPESGKLTLHVFTNVREDAITLYGFTSLSEKDLFILLVSISGIGPKLALCILSLGPEKLIQAILDEDITLLSSIPGIGKKTAGRLVLELKEKVGRLDTGSPALPGKAETFMNEVISALVNLGYDTKLARGVAGDIDMKNKEITLEEAIRDALRLLSKI